jgi:predicted nuclease with TOPRIM domain
VSEAVHHYATAEAVGRLQTECERLRNMNAEQGLEIARLREQLRRVALHEADWNREVNRAEERADRLRAALEEVDRCLTAGLEVAAHAGVTAALKEDEAT